MNNFLLETPVWKAVLSNKEVIIADDTYKDDLSDWLRLKQYCLKNKLTIDRLSISFRDNTIEIPKAKYYFFRRMVLATFGKTGRKSDTYSYFVVGSTNHKNKVHLKKYLVPEMICVEEEDRLLDNNEESLIG